MTITKINTVTRQTGYPSPPPGPADDLTTSHSDVTVTLGASSGPIGPFTNPLSGPRVNGHPGVSIGTASPDRIVAVAYQTDSSSQSPPGGIQSMTIGGISAREIANANHSPGPPFSPTNAAFRRQGIWAAKIPQGTSEDILVNHDPSHVTIFEGTLQTVIIENAEHTNAHSTTSFAGDPPQATPAAAVVDIEAGGASVINVTQGDPSPANATVSFPGPATSIGGIYGAFSRLETAEVETATALPQDSQTIVSGSIPGPPYTNEAMEYTAAAWRKVPDLAANYQPGTYEQASSATNFTFPAVSIGTASSERAVVVVAHANQGPAAQTLDAVRIGPDVGTDGYYLDAYNMATENDGPSATVTTGIWAARVQEGTSVEVQLRFGGAKDGAAIEVFTIDGLASLQEHNANTNSTGAGNSLNQFQQNMVDGIEIAASSYDVARTNAWSGGAPTSVEAYDKQWPVGPDTRSGFWGISDGITRSITTTATPTTPSEITGVAVSWDKVDRTIRLADEQGPERWADPTSPIGPGAPLGPDTSTFFNDPDSPAPSFTDYLQSPSPGTEQSITFFPEPHHNALSPGEGKQEYHAVLSSSGPATCQASIELVTPTYGPGAAIAVIESVPTTATKFVIPWNVDSLPAPEQPASTVRFHIQQPSSDPSAADLRLHAVQFHTDEENAEVILPNATSSNPAPSPGWNYTPGGPFPVNNIDEEILSDGSGLDANFKRADEVGDGVLIDFTTPTDTPMKGKDKQRFDFAMTMHTAGGPGTPVNTEFSVELYDNGTLAQRLEPVTVPETDYPNSPPTPYLFSRYWDAENLTTASGANVQVRLQQLDGGSPANDFYGQLEAVNWIKR